MEILIKASETCFLISNIINEEKNIDFCNSLLTLTLQAQEKHSLYGGVEYSEFDGSGINM